MHTTKTKTFQTPFIEVKAAIYFIVRTQESAFQGIYNILELDFASLSSLLKDTMYLSC